VPNCVLGLWMSRSGRLSVYREEVKLLIARRGVLYIDSFAGNLFYYYMLSRRWL
jgi:hypothetical protein